jgi:hypothetical protein
MSKRYRPWKIDEPMLLSATVQEFVDKNHLARFVLSLVRAHVHIENQSRSHHRIDVILYDTNIFCRPRALCKNHAQE